jgi:hypothetical protein
MSADEPHEGPQGHPSSANTRDRLLVGVPTRRGFLLCLIHLVASTIFILVPPCMSLSPRQGPTCDALPDRCAKRSF